MDNFYLFEAGATHTQLLYRLNGSKQEMSLPGFNPNRNNGAFEVAVREVIEIEPNANVFFYGSGLGNDTNKNLVKELFKHHDLNRLKIYDDIIGAARAAFKSMPGIIGIMGTGGLAAYYNGRGIVKRRGGYGYLVDDLGGGFELGRIVISAWLNDDLTGQDQEKLSKELAIKKEDILGKVYSETNLQLISNVSNIAPNLEGNLIRENIRSYFKRYLEQNVMPLANELNLTQLSIVGSVGMAFHAEIRNLVELYELQLDQCIQSPIRRLYDFHVKQM